MDLTKMRWPGDAKMRSSWQVCLDGSNLAGVAGARLLILCITNKPNTRHTSMEGPISPRLEVRKQS